MPGSHDVNAARSWRRNRRPRLLAVAGALAATLIAACSPSPTSAQPATDADLQRQLTLPPGLKVQYFAHVPAARWMVLGADGSVYVSASERGNIVRLHAFNRAGVPDSQTVIAEGLNEPHGMAFHKRYFYVANNDGVVRFGLDARGVPTGSPAYVNHYGGGSGHSTRTIVFGPDSAMYVSDGSSCNVCVEHDSTRATVMRFDENGANGRIFASGLRNAVGVAVDPATKQIWVTQNERDNLEPDHQNSPPDELKSIKDGGTTGGRTAGATGRRVPSFMMPSRCAPTMSPPSESRRTPRAARDHVPRPGDGIAPGDARRCARGVPRFMGREMPTGDKIVRVHIVNGQPLSYDDFITGWQLSRRQPVGPCCRRHGGGGRQPADHRRQSGRGVSGTGNS